MARKKRVYKRREEKEEYEFIPPEFDEAEFIHKDLYMTRVLLVITALALVIGVAASFIHKAWQWYGGLLLMLLCVVSMKRFLALLRFDSDVIEGKTMVGNYIMFVLLSLGVWILLVNPPFA